MSSGRHGRNGSAPVLITGGFGFIGTNLAHALLSEGRHVIIFDNLSRPGTDENRLWLESEHPAGFEYIRGDVRDKALLDQAVREAAEVYHFAAQVAVTTSLADPAGDFEVNLCGTVNLLEAIRRRRNPPFLLFTSTNKVYGNLSDTGFREAESRWEPEDEGLGKRGIGEAQPLDFHSPYGCSKGASDQYVLDYARSYGIPAVVFRMSCIYGTHQFGTEDQGWVAHFLIKALRGETITIYGDGKQVRDILFVDDLVGAFRAAQKNVERVRGRAFNIGGTAANTVSLLELLELITLMTGRRPGIEYASWRQGDQRYYVSDTSRFTRLTGWKPETTVREGVGKLYAWLESRSERSASLREREAAG